jgi:hypothetical protein
MTATSQGGPPGTKPRRSRGSRSPGPGELSRRRTGPAFLLAVVGGAALAVGAGSCRDVVGNEDIDAVGELCSTLTNCYGGTTSCEVLAQVADQGSASDRGSFLKDFDLEVCLGSCAGSRGCLDVPLFCAGVGEACGPFDSCCDREAGLSECRRDAGVAECCARDGVRCTSSDDCCDAECSGGYCGGFQCLLVDQACRFNPECCTQRCVDGACEARDCSALNEACIDTAECCEPTVVTPEGTRIECLDAGTDGTTGKTCQLVADQQCFLVGDPCDPGGGGPVGCCEGLACEVAVVTGEPFCVGGPGGCKVDGFDCAVDADCCDERICFLDFVQSYCTAPMGCLKAGTECGGNLDCCSGACFDGVCLQGTGINCSGATTGCHAPTQVGAVIAPDCGAADGCVNAVKEADAFCACTAWDAVCVEAYLACAS